MNPPERETHESATIAEPMAAGRAKRRRRRRQNIVSAVGVASLLCLLTAPSALAADSVNWANAGGNKISFANLDGSDGGDLNTTGATVSGPVEVAIDPAAGRIYWANATAGKISLANLDGSGGASESSLGPKDSRNSTPSKRG